MTVESLKWTKTGSNMCRPIFYNNDDEHDISRYRRPRKAAGSCHLEKRTSISSVSNTEETYINSRMKCAYKHCTCTSNSIICDFRRRSWSKTFVIFTVFFLLNHFLLTNAAVAKVPRFLDLDAAIESSRCTVRENVVDVRKVHPTIPSNVVLTPSCVVLNQCSGCCQSDVLQCKPTSIYNTKIMISRRFTDSHISDEIIVNLTHHAACACKPLSDNTPVCVEKDCGDGEEWSSSDCSCVPRSASLCQPRQCSSGERWNTDICACQPVCAADNCARGEMWESFLCPIERCPFGQKWSIRECSCVQKCPPQTCGDHEVWNPELCKCQCRPCHPKRLYHTRFNQNLHTCQCSCRSEQHSRAQCRKRRVNFDPRTCTCEYSHSKHRKNY